MKKYLLILTSLLLLQISGAYAAGSCTVKSGPTTGFTKYTKDLTTVLSEVDKDSKSSTCGASGPGVTDNIAGNSNRAAQTITADVNELLEPNGFESSWEFNLAILYLGKIPDEFYRDHDYIESLTTKINKAQKTLGKKCALYKSAESSKLIDLAKEYKIYDDKHKNLSDILSGFRKINLNSAALLRCTVVGSLGGCANPNKDVVIYATIQTDYSLENLAACNKEDPNQKGLGEQISAVFNGENSFGQIEKGINEWKDAIKLLLGGDVGKQSYEEIEKKLLAKELARQGVSASQATAILANLECMNTSSDVINKCILKKITTGIESLSEQVELSIEKMFKQSGATKNYTADKSMLESKENILREIGTDYNNLYTLMKQENKIQETGVANLIQLHQNLVSTNKQIEVTITTSEQVCDLQAQGEGNCKAAK